MYYGEFALEIVRRAEFPERVSRLGASFAFESQATAEAHRANLQPERPHYVYAVTIDPETSRDALDMAWVDALNQFRSFDGMLEAIRHYWRGDRREPAPAVEILSGGGLRVVARLTAVADDERP